MLTNDTIEKCRIFAFRVKIATLTSPSSENRSNLEKNKTNLSICDILAILSPSFIKIYPVVAEIGLPVPKLTQNRAVKIDSFFAIVQQISAATPVKFVY